MKFSIVIKIFLGIVSLLSFCLAQNAPGLQGLTVIVSGENFRIHPSDVTQTEVFITVHPSNPDLLFASANTINFNPFFISEGIYASSDGGQSWTGSDTCKGEPIQFHGGDPGIAIDKDGTFIITRLGRTPFPGLYSHFSTDSGVTWSGQNTITTDDLERASVVTDGFPGSGNIGNTYAVWVKFAPPFPMVFTRTNDGAANWSSPLQINNPAQRNAGGDVAVSRDGTVHVCWAGVANNSPFTEILVGFATSGDGGNNWNVTENAFEMNGIQGTLAEKSNIRVNGLPRIAIDNSGGPRDGWIYIITTEKDRAPAGSDPDIILHRSIDGGASWSAGIRVNQDPPSNGKIQYFPALAVDNDGGINVIYYDDRSTSSDSTGVFLSRSTDGGDNWTDVEISDHHFQPVPIGGLGQGYQGDNIDVTNAGNTLWPVWMDNVSGVYQIWTAPVKLPIVGLEDEASVSPETFQLFQNYPNPFNPETNFKFQISSFALVEFSIFDIAGRKVKTLIHQQLSPGEHVIRWDGRDRKGNPAASGIYFYRLRVSAGEGGSASFSEARKMILLR